MVIKKPYARLAQLVERNIDVVDVRGSNPLPRTSFNSGHSVTVTFTFRVRKTLGSNPSAPTAFQLVRFYPLLA